MFPNKNFSTKAMCPNKNFFKCEITTSKMQELLIVVFKLQQKIEGNLAYQLDKKHGEWTITQNY